MAKDVAALKKTDGGDILVYGSATLVKALPEFVDARNGFAQPALALVRPHLVKQAKACGIAMAAIRDSHHFGALGLDVEPFATEGLIAMSFVNGVARMVPDGGRKPVYGTNPMAFAAPREGQPVVFDQASSAMANGDIRLAAREGRPVSEGIGLDRNRATFLRVAIHASRAVAARVYFTCCRTPVWTPNEENLA